MDLLSGYGSSSDSDSQSSSAPPVEPPSSSMQSERASNQVTNTAVPTITRENLANKQAAKRKRLLRLNAVLPSEIFDRLTRANDGVDLPSSSSSEEESDDVKQSISRKRRTIERKKMKGALSEKSEEEFVGNKSGDVGITNLLSDLYKMKSTTSSDKPNNKAVPQKVETMGMAFTQVSSEVVRKKRKTGPDMDQVVDIHSAPTKQEKVSVEDASDDSNEDDDNVQSEKVIDMFPSTRDSRLISATSVSSLHEKGKSSKRSFSSAIPRPTASRFTPTVPSSFQMQKTPRQTYAQPSQMHQTQTQRPSSVPHPHQQAQQQTSGKKSKKMLEKALRSGDFSGIEDSATSVSGSIMTDSYIPNSGNVNIQAEEGVSSHINLPTYVPTEGDAVNQTEVSSKQRSKHQIHSLVASAAKLQSQRLRASTMGLGNSNASRADAKRKYGW